MKIKKNQSMSARRRWINCSSCTTLAAPFLFCLSGILASAANCQITVNISPTKDNTLIENSEGALSDGAGIYFFAGKTAQLSDSKRRGVIAFNITDSIPAGATIQSVTLTLHMSKSRLATAQTISLRRLLSDWGEGTSNAALEEGGGAASTTNSATWIHRFYPSTPWSSNGGDFSGIVSASTSVGIVGTYSFASTFQMVDDVQGWLDDPANNFGWIVLGNETVGSTAKRFDTKENSAANRPKLTVTYLPPPCCVNIRGDVNDDGADATVLDLSYLVDNIFRGGPPADCPEEADINNDTMSATVLDLTYLIDNIFRGGPLPPSCF